MVALRIPDGLTIRVSTNAKKKVTTVVAYRKGGFKRAYKAVLPMCFEVCREKGPHSAVEVGRGYSHSKATFYHPRDVDVLVIKIAKSYC